MIKDFQWTHSSMAECGDDSCGVMFSVHTCHIWHTVLRTTGCWTFERFGMVISAKADKPFQQVVSSVNLNQRKLLSAGNSTVAMEGFIVHRSTGHNNLHCVRLTVLFAVLEQREQENLAQCTEQVRNTRIGGCGRST